MRSILGRPPGRYDCQIRAVRHNGVILENPDEAFDFATAFTYDAWAFGGPGVESQGFFTVTNIAVKSRRITETHKIVPATVGSGAELWIFPDGAIDLRVAEGLYVRPCQEASS